jgi:membrane protein implicated in regulation of membrane protease activity
MEQHIKAFLALNAALLVGLMRWLGPWLPTIDIVLRIALSIAGIVGIYYSSRYYKRHTRARDDGQDSGV